ncbi:MAG: hypothetical protein ACREV1_19005 [Gammaproteobacteria bacterium]
MRVFLEAIARAERGQRRTELLLMRAAQTDGKGFDRVLKSL